MVVLLGNRLAFIIELVYICVYIYAELLLCKYRKNVWMSCESSNNSVAQFCFKVFS